MSDPKRLALALVVLKYVADQVLPATKELRADAARELSKKERIVALSPLTGEPLGTIAKSSPKAVADVNDLDALTRWLSERYPELVSTERRITGPTWRVVVVLAEHAPELLGEPEPVVATHDLNTLLTLSRQAGEPVGPSGVTDS